MALDRISLIDFRNHAATELGETAQFNLLVGENGAGKTNILEALSLLAPGRGLRRAALSDMMRSDSGTGFRIGADLRQDDGPVRLGTYMDSANPGRRRVRINGAESSATGLGEWLAVTWLTPAMDGLFTGSAADRRRYMDRLALALDPAHASHAARYEAALRERNRLLADRREPEGAWLDAIEAQMVPHGAALMRGRARLVETLAVRLAEMPAEPFARPALTYAPGAPDHADGLSQALFDNRALRRAKLDRRTEGHAGRDHPRPCGPGRAGTRGAAAARRGGRASRPGPPCGAVRAIARQRRASVDDGHRGSPLQHDRG
jgi:DNA replication and repair protein RecF